MTSAPESAAPAPPTNSEARRTRGEILGGRYTLGMKLGEGGMGVVYQARDTVLHRTVAVKVFRDGAAETARTMAETHMLAGLNHSSLVTLFDAQVGEEVPRYLVMEYVDGPTLGERLAAGPLSAKSVALMARDLGDALHAVHSAGIVHRDIKPSNVLLRASSVPGEDFRAKLADFGIAYLVDTTRLTAPGTVMGSAAYLSPEQVRGAVPATASDVYSLGLLLLEALTGQRGFPQTSVHEAAIVRLTQDPVIPGTVGDEWAALIRRMTSREPEQRPTARELMTLVAHLEMREVTPGEPGVTSSNALDSPHPSAPTVIEVASRSVLGEPELQDMRTVEMRSQEPATPPPRATARPSRVKRWILLGIVVILLIAGAVTAAVVSGEGARESPDPSLPALEEPLNTHMNELLDAVTP